ncbi:MAG TPA: short-chain dehydrogenase/reductase [Solirubrobacterales bacterium]|nr:short-chain dehydrogenase/reductase [Solirubrobacterales bacterium]
MSKFPVKDKVALVTGAAGGIGLATAKALHAKGATVVLADLDDQATRKAAESIGGDRAIGLAADVTDRSALDTAVATTIDRFGKLDIVVANAGVAPPLKTVRVLSEDDYMKVIAVNQNGVWNTVRAALPQIIEQKGHVVIVSSIYAFFNGMGQVPYAMSKAAVEQLARALREELSIHGASATVAHFGFIDTAMVQNALADPLAERVVKHTPPGLGKKLQPAAAGQAIADAIEDRKRRVIRPKRWTALHLFRGFLGPLDDRAIASNGEIRKIMHEAEDRVLDSSSH